ncbi:MAG: Bax inhibitor-1/YccA family protein [Pseudohongiellaceae bacterium]|nr:Bax inhibitor-1/YccA family protein [Pseudohongiellaceae bacterium]
MSQFENISATHTQSSGVAVNKVLKNTYLLLSLTLGFSAVTAALSTNAAPMNIWVYIIGVYGLLFATQALARSAWGLVTVFAFAGLIGYGTGPLIGYLLSSSGGSEVLTTALGGTAFIFLGLSGYALVSGKDFQFLSGFITAGFFVLIAAMIMGFFFQTPALQLAISVGFMVFSSAIILYQTGQIINGGERNYILATITLFVSIYNLFMSLIHLLMAFSGDE